MSTINPVVEVQNKKSNQVLNTGIGTAAGAVIGSGLGYITTKVVKDGAPTDKFVHSVTKEYCIERAKTNSIMEEVKLNILIDKLKALSQKGELTAEEIKSFLEKNKNYFKKELEKINNGKADEVLSSYKNMVQRYNQLLDKVKEGLVKSLDASGKKFDYTKLGSKIGLVAESTEFGFKLGNAMKYGAIAGVGLGLASLIGTKLVERNKQN